MRIISLRLRNYRKFREANIEFGDGIIAITGLNGAGKSTIVEAIAWALYGNDKRVTRKGDSKEGIRSVNASRSEVTGVYLDFEIDGNTYRLAREMRGRSGVMVVEIWENGRSQASGDRAVSRFVEKKIGLDVEGFLTSVFARQKELNALSDPQPEKRRRKIEKMLGLDAIDTARQMIKEDRKRIKSTLEGLKEGVFDPSGMPVADSIEAEISGAEDKISRIRNELSEKMQTHEQVRRKLHALEKDVEELRRRQKEHSALDAEMRERSAELRARESEKKELEDDLKRIENLRREASELEEYAGRYMEKMAEMNAMRDEKEKHLTRKALEDRRREQLEAIKGIKEEIHRVEKKIDEMQIGNAEELAALIENLREAEKEARKRKGEMEGSVSTLKRQIKKLKHDRQIIEEEGPESKCPTCHRRLGEDFHQIIGEISAEIAGKEREMKEIGEEIESIGRKLSEIEKRIEVAEEERRSAERDAERMKSMKREKERYEKELAGLEEKFESTEKDISELGEVKFNEKLFEKLKKEVNSLEETHRKYSDIKAQIKREKHVKERISVLNRELGALRSEISVLKGAIKELAFSEGALKKKEKELNVARDDERALASSIIALKKDIELMEEKVRSRKERLEELLKKMEKIEEYTDEARYLDGLDSLLKNFRTSAILKIRPALQDIASNLFNSMTDGKYSGIEIDDDYNLRIMDVGGSYPIGRFSGGEEDLANLCLRLAISEVVVKVRGSAGVNFLVLDEIFGSQDRIRRENILRALQSLSNRFHQIFLISHIDIAGENRSMVLEVSENENGESSIRVD